MRKTLARRNVAIAVVIVLVGGGGLWWWTHRSSTTTTAATQTTVAASVQTLSQSISATGTITPAVQSNLRFATSGTVTSVAVKVGDKVSANQQVATIDPANAKIAVNLAAANVNAASASLTTAKSSSTTTAAQLAAANSQLASANAKLASAQASLTSTTLVSPIAGTVASVSMSVGDQVAGSGTSSGGSGGSGGSGSGSSGSAGATTAQIVVITTDSWTVTTSVSSGDLPSLKQGLQATILPSGSRTPIFGTVSTVGVVATTSGGVTTFPVTIAVTGSPAGLYAGGSANVSITVREIADALTVPTAAVQTANGQSVVMKVVNGQPVSAPVQVGMVQGPLTQITSGLAEGDQVIVEGRAGFGTSGSTGTRTRGTGTGPGAGAGAGGPGSGAGLGAAPTAGPTP